MKAEIISIGDELLIGQVVNTNASWMAEKLNQIGVVVSQVTVIGDTREAILNSLEEATKRVDVVLITGGLGPTRDDITKKVLCEFFQTYLVHDPVILEDVRRVLTGRAVLNNLNKDQALVPRDCEVLRNPVGTAPGTLFYAKETMVVSMPGVPHEMKYLMEHEVVPRLKEKGGRQVILHRTLMVSGLPESMLAERIASWEDALPDFIKLAYLPSPGLLRLRLSAYGVDQKVVEAEMERQISLLRPLLQGYLFSETGTSLEVVLGDFLEDKGLTIGTAESCTGGRIAALLTKHSGSSAFFKGGIVAYENSVKEDVLGVASCDLQAHGAVSQPVVEQMVRGAAQKLKVDVVIATSGIAGPEGGTEEKPVGTVWVAVGNSTDVVSQCFHFGKEREKNMERSILAGLDMARKWLGKHFG